MKIGILTMEAHENRQKNTVGSSRIRGTWISDNWPEAELFRIGVKYDAIIFQKAYHLDYMRVFDGIKVFDLCDPDWLDGKPVKETIDLCDAVTTSTEALAEYVRGLTDKPVVCIPDRLDLKHHEEFKEHRGEAQSCVWFGYHTNQKTLGQCLRSLKRLGLTLTVISDAPYIPDGGIEGIDEEWTRRNLTNVKYDQDYIHRELVRNGDILLNPRLETGRFRFKSNNKSLTGYALGLPVAETAEDLERFMDEAARIKEAKDRRTEVELYHYIDLSIEAYKELIAELHEKRSSD